ncbi:MAG: glycosyltransferase family 39 protein [Candidatus Goldbacteria bacterium]|nr:glycosyltransferase family 39 protein [Candidatus Goldiibacteriota bacterium]
MTAKKNKIKVNSRFWTYFALFAVILTALILRLYQPDWYNDRQFHPDERWIVGNAVPSLNYPGRPLGLQYGSLPLYILSFYKNFLNDLRNNGWVKNLDTNRALIGGARVISGLVDTGTIIFIFLTGMLLFKPAVALMAATLLAFTTLHIHAAHFFTVDTFTAFFVAGVVYFSARIYKKGAILDYILAGVFYGASLASKSSALPAAFAILTGHLLYFFSIKGKGKSVKELKINSWVNLGIAAAVSFISFFIFMPYAIIDFKSFMNDQNYQRRILVTGEGDVPYNRQYLHTTPYLYYIKNLVLYTMGIPFGIAAFAAFLYYIIKVVKNFIKQKFEDKGIMLILSWMVPYFLIVGVSFGKFNRYMLLFTPFLALITAKFLYDLFSFFKEKKWPVLISAVVMGGAAFYGLAFMNVYTNSHTWIQASRWMYKNIPEIMPGSNPPKRTTILNEQWGDDLPVYADGKGGWIYNITKWNLQEPDSPGKIEELSSRLAEADYVVMADKRAYGTYMRLPQRYPINYFYYSTMLKEPEKLGFKLAYEKAVYPSFLGITIKDDNADESFQLYDHPHVYIFKNEKYLPKEELKAILIQGENQIRAKYSTKSKIKGFPNPNIGLLRDRPIALLPVISVFMWYLLVQLLSFIVMPLHFKVFNNFADKGYGLAKISGIFIFAWLNWIIVSCGLFKFYQKNLFILFFVLLILSFIAYRNKLKEVNSFVKENKRHILFTEIVFLASYLFFIIIKLWAPDIHNVSGHGYNGGGEPMGMAYLSAIYNDVKFPPHDPWLSGWTLNYYYWGQLMLATLSKLLGYEPRITYNLSLALLFALCFTGAFTLVYNMTKKYGYALFGSFLLALSGNFHTLEFILDKLWNANNLSQFINSTGVFQFIWDPTRIYPTPVITEMPFFSYLYGDLHAHNIVIPIMVFGFALIYNVILHRNKTTNFLNSFGDSRINVFLSCFMIALILGAMLPMNTWNFPPMLILVAVAFFIVGINLFRDNFKITRKIKTETVIKNVLYSIGIAVVSAIVLTLISYVLYIPFHSGFQSPYKTSPHLISKAERASLYVMFKYFSVFFFIIFAYIYFVLGGGIDRFSKKLSLHKMFKIKKPDFNKIMGVVVKVMNKINDNFSLSIRFYVTVIILILFLIIFGFVQETFAFLLVMAAVVLWVLFTTKDRTEIFSMLLLFISIGIIWGTEIYFIADGRMNTVFKFYMVAWTMLSIAVPYLLFKIEQNLKIFNRLKNRDWLYITGIVLFLLITSIFVRFFDLRRTGDFLPAVLTIVILLGPLFAGFLKEKLSKYIFAGSLIFLLVPAVLYPLFGSIIKMDICSLGFRQKPRIDGLLYMKNLEQRMGSVRDFDKYDYETIEWINKNFKSIDPILETHGEWMYTGSSRISIFTGMPTLVGWGYQVSQQSGRSSEVSARTKATDSIYTATDLNESKRLMKDYGLKYFYIGSIEKKLYPNCFKLAELGEPVYQNAGAVLYKLKE